MCGDRVDKLVAAHALVGRHALGQVREHFGRDRVRVVVALRDEKGLWHLAGLEVGAGDHGRVGDERMRHQRGLELGWGNVEALVLDELLEAVDDVQEALAVDPAHVPLATKAALRRRLSPALLPHVEATLRTVLACACPR